MPQTSKARQKTFEIGYKGHYYEHEDWFAHHVHAPDQEDALQKFAKAHFIDLTCQWCECPKSECQSLEMQAKNPHPFQAPPVANWEWEEGDWLMTFRYIRQVKVKLCPRCKGTGQIAVEAKRGRILHSHSEKHE